MTCLTPQQSATGMLCYEVAKEMEAGPPEPVYRYRFQTASRCFS
jgi:hypothetical protein